MKPCSHLPGVVPIEAGHEVRSEVEQLGATAGVLKAWEDVVNAPPSTNLQ